jgi:hypothetical protein
MIATFKVNYEGGRSRYEVTRLCHIVTARERDALVDLSMLLTKRDRVRSSWWHEL